jgi:hypothetical protein
MPKHYTQEDFDKLTKRYAITEDPDDLGCVPTVTKKADMNTLQKDREKLRKKSESEKVAEQLYNFMEMVSGEKPKVTKEALKQKAAELENFPEPSIRESD